jgi:hypothetical protein
MPKLSLWKDQKTADYRFFDRTISEMFTVGATDLYIHKYIGSNNPVGSQDATLPHYPTDEATNIQDLLFLENRDRKYDSNIYRLRGHYNVQNLDFDLSQFGLFLTNDIIFVTVHYNDMIDVIGRKLMVGDVFELPHLTDWHPLNESLPVGLRRYYQITDANYASEGFSSTWWPHLWRIKCEPLVDSQEFSSILSQPIRKDNYMGDWDPTKSYQPGYTITYGDKIYTPTQPVPPGTPPTDTDYWQLSTELSLRDVISRYNKNIQINDANLQEAARLVPKSGYDVNQLYVLPTYDGSTPAPPVNIIVEDNDTPGGMMITTISSPRYLSSSTVLRIPKQSIPADLDLSPGNGFILSSAISNPVLTDGGSGPVSGSTHILATPLGVGPSTGPYGTADNTYATGDQVIEYTATTAAGIPPNSTVIPLQTIPSWFTTGLVVRAQLPSSNGTINEAFSTVTSITAVNTTTKTITVNNPTLITLPAGTPVEVSYNFTGTPNPDMDYLADADPRFTFIRRSTPRNFGWLAGYLTGDEFAPNGEPVGTGIAFPAGAVIGDYFLRIDYLPQKLFRFDGKRWIEISRNVRTPPTLTASDESLISTFINNTATVATAQGTTIPSRQGLSQILKIQPD